MESFHLIPRDENFLNFQNYQQITELWHFEILQRVCVAQVFLLILHENLKFKKL